MQLPLVVEDITAEWLTAAMAPHLNGVRVDAVKIDTVIWGTGCKVLMNLEYNVDPGPDGPPRSLCIKGGFDPKQREFPALVAAYRREAEFHALLAPGLDIPLMPCWFAAADAGQGVIVLSDLLPLGVEFSDCTRPLSVDRVAAGVEVLAGLHAATWSANDVRYPWLKGLSPVRENAKLMLEAPYWNEHFASGNAPPVPDEFREFKRMRRAFEQSWRVEDAAAFSVVHNDSHLGNTAFTVQGKFVFFDWQCVCIGAGVDDFADFIVGALTIDDRRAHEKTLLRHYLDALAGKGGPRLDFDAAWLDYRRLQMHGFWWALTPPTMQPLERVAAMTARHIAAMKDLDSLRALESV